MNRSRGGVNGDGVSALGCSRIARGAATASPAASHQPHGGEAQHCHEAQQPDTAGRAFPGTHGKENSDESGKQHGIEDPVAVAEGRAQLRRGGRCRDAHRHCC